jgi:glucan phosphoethanolaminetransferase (alkaline phosphatase superfamily)
MDFQEKENKYQNLRDRIRANRKVIQNLRNITKVLITLLVGFLILLFYTNIIIEIENNFTKISKFVVASITIFLIGVNYIIKKRKEKIRVIDNKINILINIG